MKRPYLNYRPSGVEWLGTVPEHWDVRQLGRLGSFFKGGGGTKEDEVDGGVPCVRYGDLYTQHNFLIRRSRAGIAEESTGRYRRLQYGDLLFAGSGETIEEIGKSAVNLIEGPAYCGGDVIGFRPHVVTNATFFGYAADCSTASYQKACMGRGVTVMHIYSSELKNMLIALPPPAEQQSIAAFLDAETAKIDMLVAKKRLLLDRLAEFRTALITRTVTKGLPPEAAKNAGSNPNPPLKASGVEWLGDIPEHWEVKQLRRIAHLHSGDGISSDEIHPEGDYPVIGANGVRGYTDRYAHEGEAVIIGRVGAECGSVYLAGGQFWASDNAVVTWPVGGESALWLYCLLDAMNLHRYSTTTAQPLLTAGHLSGLLIPIPPVKEQRAIASFLDRQTERIDTLYWRVEAAIERCRSIGRR